MKLPIVKEGLNLVKFFLVFALAGYILGKFNRFFYLFTVCSLLFTIFLVYFFRDPERIIARDENVIFSPADGRIMEITEVSVQAIKIFMSPFNVHIQRAPVSGKVVNIEYKKGKFLPAQKSEASERNEQNIISIEHGAKSKENFISGNQRDLSPLKRDLREKSAVIRVTVKQIAGIIARRIICWTKTGAQLTQGEKIGMIALGSQVDLYLPQEVNLKVKVGDKVKAGLTVLATFTQ